MGIKRLLAMIAMRSCSADRAITLAELRLIPSAPDRGHPRQLYHMKLKGPITGPRGSFYRPEKACPRPERDHSSPDIRNLVQDLRGFILGLREPIITAC